MWRLPLLAAQPGNCAEQHKEGGPTLAASEPSFESGISSTPTAPNSWARLTYSRRNDSNSPKSDQTANTALQIPAQTRKNRLWRTDYTQSNDFSSPPNIINKQLTIQYPFKMKILQFVLTYHDNWLLQAGGRRLKVYTVQVCIRIMQVIIIIINKNNINIIISIICYSSYLHNDTHYWLCTIFHIIWSPIQIMLLRVLARIHNITVLCRILWCTIIWRVDNNEHHALVQRIGGKNQPWDKRINWQCLSCRDRE